MNHGDHSRSVIYLTKNCTTEEDTDYDKSKVYESRRYGTFTYLLYVIIYVTGDHHMSFKEIIIHPTCDALDITLL